MTVPSPLYFVLWRPLCLIVEPSAFLTDFIAFLADFIAFIADPDAPEVPDDEKDTHVDAFEVPDDEASRTAPRAASTRRARPTKHERNMHCRAPRRRGAFESMAWVSEYDVS